MGVLLSVLLYRSLTLTLVRTINRKILVYGSVIVTLVRQISQEESYSVEGLP